MGLEDLPVDPGLEIKPLQERLRGQLEQVGEAGAITGEEREVVARLLLAARVLLEAAAGGDVGLVADDRIDPGGPGSLIELQGA